MVQISALHCREEILQVKFNGVTAIITILDTCDELDRLTGRQVIGGFATFTKDAVGNITIPLLTEDALTLPRENCLPPSCRNYKKGSEACVMQMGASSDFGSKCL